ncbi:isochorismate synthase [Robertmurraya korlensis]|uniref:isochorismate synthase n=1 Tax=Robertmurraya korlensis TaxID=519977 RepID=UPI0008262C2D|nr:isochorismate synthase [Robertmurraya korlensis]
MVTIQNTELKEGIIEAIERARKLSMPVLVSEVQRIHPIQPLSVFAAGRDQFVGERFFWKDPSDEVVMIGIGICKEIQSDQASGRFFHVEKQWQKLMNNSIMLMDEKQSATGPVMFGGFSFDPLKEKTNRWAQFSHSLFHIPKYLVSVIKGEYFLTTNIICTAEDDEALYEVIDQERKAILGGMEEESLPGLANLSTVTEVNPEGWKKRVSEVVELLKAGTMKKVVLARELRLQFEEQIPVEPVIMNLLEEQRESFVFAFESKGDCFIGASPERLVKKVKKDVYSTCLAGSIARGKSLKEDEELGNELLSDEKNLNEHQFVVDMIKEAMDKVCHEVRIPARPQLMKMKHIQHLYTPVVGVANEESSLLQLVNLLHPTPALGGLPRKEAVQSIRTMEDLDRGMYAAPIGWIDFDGNGEFAVAIRSGLLQGDEASLFAGCGIVKDSDVESEYHETNIKFRPMLSALRGN